MPGIMEWPAVIKPRITSHPASTMDLFPTVADIVGLPAGSLIQPVDGVSLKPLFTAEIGPRAQPIGFRFGTKTALVDNGHKILANNLKSGPFELYDLEADPNETRDLSAAQPELFEKMKKQLLAFNASVDASFAGRDYPEGKVIPPDPESISWFDADRYQKWLPQWKDYWAYKSYLDPAAKGAKKPGKKKED